MKYRYQHLTYVLAAALLAAGVVAASAAEIQLAGLGLGRPALTVLQKYGNPTEIRVGQNALVSAARQEAVGVPGAAAAPAGGPAMPTGGPAGLPGLPPIPGAGGGPGGLFAPAQAEAPKEQAPTPTGPPEVTWIYKFPNNRTLEVLINPDGVIVQIAAYGVNWPNISTFKGTKLGHSYKDVIFKYGYPEAQEQYGTGLLAKYPKKQRVVFTFAGKTCVGITIAL